MRIIISAQNNASSVIRGLANDAGLLSPALLAAGAAVVAVGGALVYSVIQAANFQQGLNRLVTGAGDTTDNMQKLGQGILGVSVATGVLTDKLLPAMYLILSSSQRGAQALDTLKAAAQGAQIEQANLSDVTSALTTMQNNWGVSTFTATQYMNGLIKAVSGGRITLEDLTKYMGPILPIAKQMGISFQDVASAMAVQTNAGLKAAQSATGLQAVFVNIENPTHKAAAAMKAMGVDSVAVADEMKKSLPGAIQMLMDAALKVGPVASVPFNRAMADMIGGGTRTAKTIDALTQHMSDWVKATAAISAVMKLSAADVNGWDLAQSGLNIQVSRTWAAVQALAKTIGTALLPVLTSIFMAITPIITGFATWITSSSGLAAAWASLIGIFQQVAAVAQVIGNWFMRYIWPVLQMIGNFLVATFTPVWQQMVAVWNGQMLPALKQLWAALVPLAPVLKLIAGLILGVVIVALGLFVGVLAGVLKALAGLLIGVTTIFGGVVQIITGAVQVVSGIIRFFVDLATGNFRKLGSDLGTIWLGIENMFSGIWKAIEGIFQTAWRVISGFVSGLVQGVIGFFQHLASVIVGHSIVPDMVNAIIAWFAQLPGKLLQIGAQMIGGLINGIWSQAGNLASAIGSVVHNAVGNIPGLGGILTQFHILGYQHGGIVPYTGLAYLHAGERVIPAHQAGAGSGHTFNNTFQINVQQLDPREVDRVTGLLADKLRAQMGNI